VSERIGEIAADRTSGRTLTLYPAIDIRGGRAVRLLRGDYAHETTYDADPLDAAERWQDGGAEVLHIVDLDGARAGRPENLALIERLTGRLRIPVQVGGGLRDAEAVDAVLTAGAARAVLGTRAQRDPHFVGGLAAAHGPERIVASVDARAGRVAIEGWEEATDTTVPELIAELAGLGVERFVYTPVEVDGTLAGPGITGLAAVATACADAGAELIYSGGVGSLGDLRSLAALPMPAIGGVIVGRALYEQRFTVPEAVAALASGDRR
jgi:phosphoribosylformimino-5-aminoimidazole carboxamide ribotide isomerase